MTARWDLPAWRSAAGTWRERTSTLVVAEVDGFRGLGEDAPLPGVSRDPDAAPSWARYAARLDATARARGVAMASLLSATPADRVPLAAVVDSPAAARAAVASGFRTLKLKLERATRDGYTTPPTTGDAYTTPPTGGPYTTPLAAEIRAAVGPEIAIRVDANRCLAAEDVAAVCEVLAESGVELLEEPARGVDPRGLAVPIAWDESLLDDVGLDGAAAVVIKPTILGAERTLAWIARARAAGVGVIISHALEGPVGFAACAELALAVGGTRAHGLGPHAGLGLWGLGIPTLGRGALVSTPRRGTGLDLDAALDRARRFA